MPSDDAGMRIWTMQGKKWVTPERERQVLELYEQFESAQKVAYIVGCGRQTVYNVLVKHGVKRTHRHDGERKSKAKYKTSHCRSKYCPGVIVALCNCMNLNARQIAGVTGYKESGVRNVLKKHGLVRPRKGCSKSDFDLDRIEHEYVDLGMSAYQLSDKYRICRPTISKWMRQRGVLIGKGGHQVGKHNAECDDRSAKAEKEFAERLRREFGGQFEYVCGFRDGGRKFATIRCTSCGHEFEHYVGIRNAEWQCPLCNEMASKERIEQIKREREQRLAQEYAVDKTCEQCGAIFHSICPSQKYCSKRCAKRANYSNSDYRHYYHVHGGEYDPSVTLRALYERDGGVCQICGEPCDWQDREWGTNGPFYPSLDHIVPRSKGGPHTWDNVQLAHCICNSRKSDLPDEVAKRRAMVA